jgi:oligosaccharyltransferase complex subunit gamma
MRLLSLAVLAGLAFAQDAQDAAHWSQVASQSKNGVIKLDSASYEAILGGSDREYSVVIELTAMGSQFKCQPCL